MTFTFDAYVTAALWAGEEAAFVLGDGTVRWSGGASVQAHQGAALCGTLHPAGGVATGGDDGRLVRSTPDGAETLAELPGGRWIEHIAASAASGLIAFASGRDLHVRGTADAGFARTYPHAASVAGVAMDPKGRRIATASYGGVQLWFARIEGQKPTMLKYAGSHIAVAWSPDGRFVVTAMQDNQLHGWRVADGKDMRMGGYPAKPRSLAFLADGALLATSGANSAVVWPFTGA
jgi:WD40 repeat protein